MSDRGSPSKRGGFSLLSPFKRAMSRTDSAGSLSQASDLATATTPPSGGGGLFSSIKSGQRKREAIRELQEQVDLLRYDLQHKGQELARAHQQLETERAQSVALKERLNLQHFKANLLVDMLVLKVLDATGAARPAAALAPAAPAAAAAAAAVPSTAAAAAGDHHEEEEEKEEVLQESSFD